MVTQEHGHELSKEGNNVIKMRKVLTWWWSMKVHQNGTNPTEKLIKVFKHSNIGLPAVAHQIMKATTTARSSGQNPTGVTGIIRPVRVYEYGS